MKKIKLLKALFYLTVTFSLIGLYFISTSAEAETKSQKIVASVLSKTASISNMEANLITNLRIAGLGELVTKEQFEDLAGEVFKSAGVGLLTEPFENLSEDEAGKAYLGGVLDSLDKEEIREDIGKAIAEGIVITLASPRTLEISSKLFYKHPNKVRIESTQHLLNLERGIDNIQTEDFISDGVNVAVYRDGNQVSITPTGIKKGEIGVPYSRFETTFLNYIVILGQFLKNIGDIELAETELIDGRINFILQANAPILETTSGPKQSDLLKIWIDKERIVATKIQYLNTTKGNHLVQEINMKAFQEFTSQDKKSLWLPTEVQMKDYTLEDKIALEINTQIKDIKINSHLPATLFNFQKYNR